MNKRRQRWVLAFLWMTVIFFLSSQSGNDSAMLSTSIFKPLFDLLIPIGVNSEFLSLFIRKTAHFFSYLILGILVFRAMDTYDIEPSQKMYLSLLICFGYAISDEIHQIFVPGRAGMLIDVMIDGLGSATSIVFYFVKRTKEVKI
ncbi:MAG: VanZ family protein [Erysipelotrichaceae bacterium]|nr:VanZ family protein [Erysipelotrichaceae bacterium]